jgi:hypothetical protein
MKCCVTDSCKHSHKLVMCTFTWTANIIMFTVHVNIKYKILNNYNYLEFYIVNNYNLQLYNYLETLIYVGSIRN